MTLREYLKETKLKAAEIARRTKMTRGGISRLLKGTRCPSISAAVRIHAATEGNVGLHDWPPFKKSNPRKHVKKPRKR